MRSTDRVDRTVHRAIHGFCKDRKYVAEHDLDAWVRAKVKHLHGHQPYDGHAWSLLRAMLKSGALEGEEVEPGLMRVDKIRLNPPRKKSKSKSEQLTWGWER